MFYGFYDPASVSSLRSIRTRSISAENFTGEKGKGGMATEGTGAGPSKRLGQGWKVSPSINIAPGEVVTLAHIKEAGAIRHMWMTDTDRFGRGLVLRIYWDGAERPAVECPMGDFFASAEHNEYRQLTSAVVCVNPKKTFNCYWDMPFRTECRITVENIIEETVMLFYQIDYQVYDTPREDAGYFHAYFRRINPLPYKEVFPILDTVHGRGQYVGTYMFWGSNSSGWWGEGEIKFYMDGDGEFPTICGTGTEDYFCGSHNFDVNGQYMEYCTPYAGLSKVLRPDGLYRSQTRFSMYRWHLPDPIYFEEDIRVTIQALGWCEGGRYYHPQQDDISSVAYLYLDSPEGQGPALPSREFLELC